MSVVILLKYIKNAPHNCSYNLSSRFLIFLIKQEILKFFFPFLFGAVTCPGNRRGAGKAWQYSGGKKKIPFQRLWKNFCKIRINSSQCTDDNQVHPYVLNLHFCSKWFKIAISSSTDPPHFHSCPVFICRWQKPCNDFNWPEQSLSATELVMENFPLVLTMNRWKGDQIISLGFAAGHCSSALCYSSFMQSLRSYLFYEYIHSKCNLHKVNFAGVLSICRKAFMCKPSVSYLALTEMFLHWSWWSYSL